MVSHYSADYLGMNSNRGDFPLPKPSNLQPRRVLHYAENAFSLRSSKMTTGVLRYGVHESVAVVDSTKVGRTADDVIGFGGPVPVVESIEAAMKFKPEILLLGTTPVGGRLNAELRAACLKAIDLGMDVWAGMHDFLINDPEVSAAAKKAGRELRDLRRPAPDLPVGKGRCRHAKSYISLMVGSDCAIGKMTVALEVVRAAEKKGINAEFVATGQVGIAIAGWGSPIDAIPGDFMAGAVERDVLSVDGADMILVEGQGSLLHPGYSSVTLALLHGSCPHSLILNHQVTRTEISNMETSIPLPPLDAIAAQYLELARFIRPTELVAVSFNTVGVDEATARKAIADAEDLLGVPGTDPVRFGADKLVDALAAHKKKLGL
jgi:uncharacterized NAD-dependent epimerase/dehydratase family protein